MSRNGSGTYSLPSGNPVVTGTTISSTTHNATMSDIATALTQSLAKDGQTTPSADLPMGTYKHTGVGSATARTQYATAAQVQDGTFNVLSTVAGVDTITASAPLTLAAYAEGQHFSFTSAGANTGAATLNINSLGAKSITKQGTTALIAGDIPSGAVVEVVYDGTRFQLLNVGAPLLPSAIGVSVQAYDADIPTVSASQAEMEAGTESALRSMSPLRVAQAIASLAQTGSTTGTPVATTSGTKVEFTSIPADVNYIEILIAGYSANGNAALSLLLGDAGGYETSGYVGGGSTTSFILYPSASLSATAVVSGRIVLSRLNPTDFTWVISSNLVETTAGPSANSMAGYKATSAALTQIKFTTVGESDTFDAGQINIIYRY